MEEQSHNYSEKKQPLFYKRAAHEFITPGRKDESTDYANPKPSTEKTTVTNSYLNNQNTSPSKNIVMN